MILAYVLGAKKNRLMSRIYTEELLPYLIERKYYMQNSAEPLITTV